MESKAVYQRRIRAQLSKWKKTIDSLTAEIERSGGEFTSVIVRPAVDFSSLENVLIDAAYGDYDDSFH